MSFNEAYPEIEDFFNHNHFSEYDINNLIITLTKRYNKKPKITPGGNIQNKLYF